MGVTRSTCGWSNVNRWVGQGQHVGGARPTCGWGNVNRWVGQGQHVDGARSTGGLGKVNRWVGAWSKCGWGKVNMWVGQGQWLVGKVNVWVLKGQQVCGARLSYGVTAKYNQYDKIKIYKRNPDFLYFYHVHFPVHTLF